MNSLILGKDASLASVVDEIIQLWTSTWVSDAEHDNTISENVQNMQQRSTDLIRRIMKELQNLRLFSSPGAKKKLGAVAPPRDDIQRLSVTPCCTYFQVRFSHRTW